MNVVCCQLDIVWEDKEANYSKADSLLRTAKPEPGSLVVFPEMAFTGFSMDVSRSSRNEPERTTAFLQRIARDHAVTVVAGLVTVSPSGRGRNTCVVITPDGAVAARYQKLHLFSFAGEDQHFEPGQQVVTFEWASLTVAPFICYDLRFPEAFRCAVDRDAAMLVVIANWPRPRERHWMSLLQARAIENQAYVLGVNRCGRDPGLDYSGRSQIIAPDGTVVADAGEQEGVIQATLDVPALRDYRKRFPALSDRRLSAPDTWQVVDPRNR